MNVLRWSRLKWSWLFSRMRIEKQVLAEVFSKCITSRRYNEACEGSIKRDISRSLQLIWSLREGWGRNMFSKLISETTTWEVISCLVASKKVEIFSVKNTCEIEQVWSLSVKNTRGRVSEPRRVFGSAVRRFTMQVPKVLVEFTHCWVCCRSGAAGEITSWARNWCERNCKRKYLLNISGSYDERYG